MAESIVSLRQVVRSYQMGQTRVHALRGLDLQLCGGAFSFITGPSGSGKSTVLNMIGGIDRPDSGQVEVLGYSLGTLSESQLTKFREQHLGFIFQNFNLIPTLTVFENVEYPLYLKTLTRAERRKKVTQWLELVGLAARANHLPSELSGGQQQRVAVARALVKEPQLVLADEPTANLDSHTSRDIAQLMQQLKREANVSFVICSHDSGFVQQADEVFEIIDGRNVSQREVA